MSTPLVCASRPRGSALGTKTHKRNPVAEHDFNKGGAHRDKKKYHRPDSKKRLLEQLDADS
jgi:hypothetical protein